MIVGEDQILGQIREALNLSQSNNTVGPFEASPSVEARMRSFQASIEEMLTIVRSERPDLILVVGDITSLEGGDEVYADVLGRLAAPRRKIEVLPAERAGIGLLDRSGGHPERHEPPASACGFALCRSCRSR